MPSFVTAGSFVTRHVDARLVGCNGVDAARPEAEASSRDAVWVVVSGRFSHRCRAGRVVLDPTTALLLRAGDAFEIRHPETGGDVCLAVSGDVTASVVQRGG